VYVDSSGPPLPVIEGDGASGQGGGLYARAQGDGRRCRS
jgi:hypothetical protein